MDKSNLVIFSSLFLYTNNTFIFISGIFNRSLGTWSVQQAVFKWSEAEKGSGDKIDAPFCEGLYEE